MGGNDQQASKSGSNTTTSTNSYSRLQAESGSGHHLKNELVVATT